jgi:hypothetical protein
MSGTIQSNVHAIAAQLFVRGNWRVGLQTLFCWLLSWQPLSITKEDFLSCSGRRVCLSVSSIPHRTSFSSGSRCVLLLGLGNSRTTVLFDTLWPQTAERDLFTPPRIKRGVDFASKQRPLSSFGSASPSYSFVALAVAMEGWGAKSGVLKVFRKSRSLWWRGRQSRLPEARK